MFDEQGEVNSKTAFDINDASLGRVDTLSVAPPYTVAALKSRIVKAEGIFSWEIRLFEDSDGEILMKDVDKSSFLAETFPGFLEDEALTLVYMRYKKIRANIEICE